MQTNPFENDASNPAHQHFIGQDEHNLDLRQYKEWYSDLVLCYLLHTVSNPQMVPYVFPELQTSGKKSFEGIFPDLMMVSLNLKKGIAFVTFEPGALTPHYIFGIFDQNKLLIINPMGITAHKDFYISLNKLKKAKPEIKIYLSQDVFQLDQKGIVSCGPLCGELAMNILQFSAEDCFAKITLGELTSKNDLSYIPVSIAKLLPESVKANISEFENKILTIRQKHADHLLAVQSSLNPTDPVEFWLRALNADMQVIMNELILDKSMMHVLSMAELERLRQGTSSISFPQLESAQPKPIMTPITAQSKFPMSTQTHYSPLPDTLQTASSIKFAEKTQQSIKHKEHNTDKSVIIRSNNSKNILDVKDAELGRCLYEIMADPIKKHYSAKPLDSTFSSSTSVMTVGSFGDWFKFNDVTTPSSTLVTFKNDSKSRKVEIAKDKALVKSSVHIDESGKSSFIKGTHPAESYPSLCMKLIAMAKRKPDNFLTYFQDSDFIYPDEKNPSPCYDRLIASDLLAIARGQKPQYYTQDTDIQFLTEVSVLLFGVENIATRDKSNTQLGANLLLLDMICKKQKYGKDLQHHFRINNFLDSAKLIDGVWHFKKTATYPWYAHGTEKKQRNDYAPSSTYSIITSEEHAKNLSKADTIGGISPSTTGTFTGISSGIYGDKNKFLGKYGRDQIVILKEDTHFDQHRILLKENKILFYWLKQNASDCFQLTEGTTTRDKIKQALINGLYGIINNKFQLTPLHQNIFDKTNLDMSQIPLDMLNAKDELGYTALHYIILSKNHALLEQLIKLDAIDLNCKDFQGKTPLHLAVAMNDEIAASVLLAGMQHKFITSNIHDTLGNTPLHQAILNGNIKLAQLLLSEGKQIQSITDLSDELMTSQNLFNKNNLLHMAVLSGNPEMITFIQSISVERDAIFSIEGSTSSPIPGTSLLEKTNTEGDTPLHLAIKLNNQQLIGALVTSTKQILPIKDIHGNTQLHLAVANNNFELVQHLLQDETWRQILNTPNSADHTPMHLAAINDNPEMIKLLMSHSTDFTMQKSSYSPLHIAVGKRNLTACRLLISAGFPYENVHGITPLHFLASTKNKKTFIKTTESLELLSEIIKLFPEDLNKPNSSGKTPLYSAIECGNFDIAQAMIYAGANLNIINGEKKHTPLHRTLYSFNSTISTKLQLQEELLRLNALIKELSLNKSNPFLNYQQKQDIEKDLIKAKIDINNCQDRMEGLIIREKELEHLSVILINNGAKIDIQDKIGLSALHLAFMTNNFNVITSIFNKMSPSEIIEALNKPDSRGETPLYSALKLNNQALIEHLTKLGANINNQFLNGDTLLHKSCKEKNLDAIKLLLSVGANPNIANKGGETPLHMAAELGFTDAITLLCKSGANTELKSNAHGYTPLHAAIFANKAQAVQCLMEHGSKLSTLNKYGYAPLAFAQMVQKKWNKDLRHIIEIIQNPPMMQSSSQILPTPFGMTSTSLPPLNLGRGQPTPTLPSKPFDITPKSLPPLSLGRSKTSTPEVKQPEQEKRGEKRSIDRCNDSPLLFGQPPRKDDDDKPPTHPLSGVIGSSGFMASSSNSFASSHPSQTGQSSSGNTYQGQKRSSTMTPPKERDAKRQKTSAVSQTVIPPKPETRPSETPTQPQSGYRRF